MIEYFKMWKNGFNFSGRSTRKDYWLASLVHLVILCVVYVLMDKSIITSSGFILIYTVASFFPNLSLTIRRLHDIGKSGFWIFVDCIPLIGSFVLLFFLACDSTGPNEYGESPKYPSPQYQNMNNQSYNNGYQNMNNY